MSQPPDCPKCKRRIDDDAWMYLVNPAGGYGREEYWLCEDCMKSAEPGSYVANKWLAYQERGV